jgi:hypothetical protein
MSNFVKGDAVKILTDAKFETGATVPAVFINKEFFVIEVKDNGFYRLGQSKDTKRSVGSVHEADLVSVDMTANGFEPYIILTTSEISTLIAPHYGAAKKETLPKGRLFTVIAEDSGYGRLKKDRGWIDLDLVAKLK